jgi:hypothetical protein
MLCARASLLSKMFRDWQFPLNVIAFYARSKVIKCDLPIRQRMLRWTVEIEQPSVVTLFGNGKDSAQT